MGRARRCTCVRSLHRRGNASRFAYRNRLHFDLVQRCLALRCQPTPFTQLCPCAVVWQSTSLSAGTLSVTVRGLRTEATLVRILLPSPWKPTEDALKLPMRVLRVFAEMCLCTLAIAPVQSDGDASPAPNQTVALSFER